jgi:uncharacterized membrane protein
MYPSDLHSFAALLVLKRGVSHMTEPGGEEAAGPVQPEPQQPLISNYGLVLTVYILYLVGFVTGITFLVGGIIAYLQRGKTDPVCESHIQFQIITFWLGLLFFLVGLLTIPIGIGVLILLCGAIWTLIRCVKGLLVLNTREPISNPNSWWLGER